MQTEQQTDNKTKSKLKIKMPKLTLKNKNPKTNTENGYLMVYKNKHSEEKTNATQILEGSLSTEGLEIKATISENKSSRFSLKLPKLKKQKPKQTEKANQNGVLAETQKPTFNEVVEQEITENELSNLTENQDLVIDQNLNSIFNEEQETIINKTQDPNINENEDMFLSQGQDPTVTLNKDTIIDQNIDPTINQSQDPNLTQPSDPNQNSNLTPNQNKKGFFSKLTKNNSSKPKNQKTKKVSSNKSKFSLGFLKKKQKTTQTPSGPNFFDSLKLKMQKKQTYDEPVVVFKDPPENTYVVDSYPIHPSFSNVTILSLPELGGGKAYFIDEIKLEEPSKGIFKKLSQIILRELEPPKNGTEPIAHLELEAKRLAKKYRLAKKITEDMWPKILYYLQRDFLGFGYIHVLMNDSMIEDISVNGIGLPVYVWHRKYESMPTNLTFIDETTLDNLIVKLTHLSNKHISTAFPILDGMLPGKDRLAATYRREISPKGGSFTIRRFREEPFSIIDLIEMGTINEEIAAYYWLLIENRVTIAAIGGTGAGKTSTLNALASLVKPQMKLVTVEEIPEINVPHENWVQLVSRDSYGLGAAKSGEVSLFDLVKTSLRYRPDYIVVGEIRGEEAFVLFQALATGHGGLTTLHADSIDYAVKRLISPPMNVSKIYLPLINVACMVERVQIPSEDAKCSFARRVTIIQEIIGYDNYKVIAKWNPIEDTFDLFFEESEQLKKIAVRTGVSHQEILAELKRRVELIQNLRYSGIRKTTELSNFITKYYVQSFNTKTNSPYTQAPQKYIPVYNSFNDDTAIYTEPENKQTDSPYQITPDDDIDTDDFESNEEE